MDAFNTCAVCDELRELRTVDRALEVATGNLVRQRKAFARRLCGGDKGEAAKLDAAFLASGDHALLAAYVPAVLWTVEPLEALRRDQRALHRRMRDAVRLLPVHAWAAGVPGLGELSLARIIGETGDPGMYASPAKLWKRLGLAVMPDGRQRRRTDPVLAESHGYNPRRRSVVWVMGESLLKAHGPYREVYLARLRREVEKAQAEGLVVATSAQATVDSWTARQLPAPTRLTVKGMRETPHRTVAHVNARAKRYVEKRVIRDLWRAWRGDA